MKNNSLPALKTCLLIALTFSINFANAQSESFPRGLTTGTERDRYIINNDHSRDDATIQLNARDVNWFIWNSYSSKKLVFSRNLKGKNTLWNQMVLTKNGKLGIGTTTPSEKVHIKGNFRVDDGEFQSWGSLKLHPDVDNTGDDIILFLNSNGKENMRVHNNGFLGIGTNNPKSMLQINGDLTIEGKGKITHYGGLTFISDQDNTGEKQFHFLGKSNKQYITFDAWNNKNKINGVTSFNEATSFKNNITLDGNLIFGNTTTTQEFNVRKGLNINLGNTTGSRFAINSPAGNILYTTVKGKVGIGTSTPSEKLEVSGKIKANSFVANASSFPDYVFEKDYNLMPLKEVEKYVVTNKHLPGMPTEKDVVQKGLDLKKVSVVSVEKIEELYLYILQQQSVIDSLKKRMDELETAANKK
ncbi:hypothetical protein ATE84_4381 [Aquimarina sp. MAR_2010_214]|uniref:hypothetical protein n=1 Tax=Aquimarina sp. MAR_2010_214 TaxID=1250026 RepID=UPI000C70DC6D|nr:hypothetical protein [Aquimarina sp. MAR_2010_214]PKV52271.1 hypothetical protein ATE84_4381 [Aquimarina sp. MAR_2010_214]